MCVQSQHTSIAPPRTQACILFCVYLVGPSKTHYMAFGVCICSYLGGYMESILQFTSRVATYRCGNSWRLEGGVEPGKGRVWGGKEPQWCIMPSRETILSRGIDLCQLEIICHSGRPPGFIWRLDTLPGAGTGDDSRAPTRWSIFNTSNLITCKLAHASLQVTLLDIQYLKLASSPYHKHSSAQ